MVNDPEETETESEKTNEPSGYNIQFRVNPTQYKVMVRLARMLFDNGAIKVNNVNALAKATTFTQINLYLQMEAKELAYQQRTKELELERIELEKKGINYRGSTNPIPNLGGY